MKYYAYNEDGQIVQIGECPENLLAYQKIPGVTFVVGEADPDVHYVEGGVLKAKPPRPSQFHVFSYKTKSWEPDYDAAVRHVKNVRSKLLLESDWTQLPDVPVATKEAWAAYRQALRDITEQPGFPFDVVWPEPPA